GDGRAAGLLCVSAAGDAAGRAPCRSLLPQRGGPAVGLWRRRAAGFRGRLALDPATAGLRGGCARLSARVDRGRRHTRPGPPPLGKSQALEQVAYLLPQPLTAEGRGEDGLDQGSTPDSSRIGCGQRGFERRILLEACQRLLEGLVGGPQPERSAVGRLAESAE